MMGKDKDIEVEIPVPGGKEGNLEEDALELEGEVEGLTRGKKKLVMKVRELEEKNAELKADLQRTRADFENFRKQVEAQKENERKLAKFATVSKMLPMLDDLDLAIRNYEELKPLEKSLEKTLKGLDLAKIPSEEGVEFNPDLYEAVMVEGEGEKETVAETLRAGYYYEGEVLRPAMVKVRRV